MGKCILAGNKPKGNKRQPIRAKMEPRGAKREPRGPKWEPNGSRKRAKIEPKIDQKVFTLHFGRKGWHQGAKKATHRNYNPKFGPKKR